MISYKKLMNLHPTSYGEMTNSLGQKIEFMEHPINGDYSPIICVCHKLKLAEHSGFYETYDMEADHQEYEPSFQDGNFFIGQFKS